MKNTTAFVMKMSSNDKEQDCEPLKGSNGLYEYRCVSYTALLKQHLLTYNYGTQVNKNGRGALGAQSSLRVQTLLG